MLRRVLLPLDAGDDDSRAVAFTRTLARRAPLDVLLLRVEEWPLAGPGGAYGWTPPARAGRLTRVRRSLDGPDPGGVRLLSPQAISPASVLEKARRGGASLIVLPYRREGLWSRLVHGRACQWILWDSPIPVLAVPEGAELPAPDVSRVLFVHRGGEGAVQGSRVAIELAQVFEATVGLLRFSPPASPFPDFVLRWLFGDPAGPPPASGDEGLESLFRKRGVDARALPSAGASAAGVTSWARGSSVDLVAFCRSAGADRAVDALARHLLEIHRVPVLLLRERPGPGRAPGVSPLRLRL
jgi:nucleotide-binding universal stress UspA family protein